MHRCSHGQRAAGLCAARVFSIANACCKYKKEHVHRLAQTHTPAALCFSWMMNEAIFQLKTASHHSSRNREIIYITHTQTCAHTQTWTHSGFPHFFPCWINLHRCRFTCSSLFLQKTCRNADRCKALLLTDLDTQRPTRLSLCTQTQLFDQSMCVCVLFSQSLSWAAPVEEMFRKKTKLENSSEFKVE